MTTGFGSQDIESVHLTDQMLGDEGTIYASADQPRRTHTGIEHFGTLGVKLVHLSFERHASGEPTQPPKLDQFSVSRAALKLKQSRGRLSYKELRGLLHPAESRSDLTLQQREASWLNHNRNLYPGEWIALLGDELLGHSKVATEIIDLAKRVNPKPLVMYIEADKIPFAGW